MLNTSVFPLEIFNCEIYMEQKINTADAAEKLQALRKCLETLAIQKNRGINIFEAAGMTGQEIRHSAFLAWLLQPKMPHGLGNLFLRKFCERLIVYGSPDGAIDNREIIGSALNNLETMLADPDLGVATEKVVVDKESRIDILVDSPAAKTVIVIENKVFSDAHDNQLNRYQEELERHETYRKYKKVFVYLTPNGDLPHNEDGEYDADWCIFDYRTIRDIVREINRTLPNRKAHARLKMLLEDYIELMENNILLENKELRDLCKQIYREHKDALEILLSYTDNGEEVIRYSKDWLCAHYPDIVLFKDNALTFRFYTKTIEEYFARHGEGFYAADGTAKCLIDFGQWYGPVVSAFCLTKTRKEQWSVAQKKIMAQVAPNKRQGDLYFRFNKLTLLDGDNRQRPFEEIRPALERGLEILIERVKKFDEMLRAL